MSADKAAMRLRMRVIRDAIGEEKRKGLSADIAGHVLAWERYRAAGTILAYMSMGSEVETAGLIECMQKDGKMVCLPRMRAKGRMEALLYERGDALERAAYGMFEPLEGARVIAPRQIDIALVPALALTGRGERLGYGGGCYDRYLANTDACRVAMCFSEQVVDSLPVTMYDVPMDALATPRGILLCGRSIR